MFQQKVTVFSSFSEKQQLVLIRQKISNGVPLNDHQ